jgi:hypothetical protein
MSMVQIVIISFVPLIIKLYIIVYNRMDPESAKVNSLQLIIKPGHSIIKLGHLIIKPGHSIIKLGHLIIKPGHSILQLGHSRGGGGKRTAAGRRR